MTRAASEMLLTEGLSHCAGLVNCVLVAWLYADVTMDSSDDEDTVAAIMFIATVSEIKSGIKERQKDLYEPKVGSVTGSNTRSIIVLFRSSAE